MEHRFRKGVSGNPRGRPRKTRAVVTTTVDGMPGIGPEDRIKSLALDEAYRKITVREGDRLERIPVIQAVLRKVAVAAANGNTRAQQLYLNLVIVAETDRRLATVEILKAAIDYKEYRGPILNERARTGATGPEPVPHTDDVIIDRNTGEVRILGPVTEDQKTAQDHLRERWPEYMHRLREIEETLASGPDNLEPRKEMANLNKILDWLLEDSKRRFLRDALRKPPSYRRKRPR